MKVLKSIEEADTPELKKYYTEVTKNLEKVIGHIKDSNFKKGIIKECESLFIDYNFGQNIDQIENSLGVGNGVLILGPTPQLIQHYHDYPITKFTPVNYVPYNPHNPWIQRMEKIFRDLFPVDEQDTYEFIMCWLALSIDFRSKAPLVLFLIGIGANGKTMLIDMLRAAIGDDFAKSHSTDLFTSDFGNPGSANTAIMALKYSRANFYDETGDNTVIQDRNLKTLASGVITGSEKYKTQTSFTSKGSNTFISNHRPILHTNDHGTWRRILFTNLKMRFRLEDDPNDPYDSTNPYHRKLDETIKDVLINKPEAREAILSILVKWYVIAYRKYKGSITNVPRPTITKETNEYRLSQDSITLWISTNIVQDSDSTKEYPISDFTNSYLKWYEANIGVKQPKTQKNITDAIATNNKLKELNCVINDVYGIRIKGFKPLIGGAQPDVGEKLVQELVSAKVSLIAENFRSVDHRMTLDEYIQCCENKRPVTQIDKSYYSTDVVELAVDNIATIDNIAAVTMEHSDADNMSDVLTSIAEYDSDYE